MPTRPTDPERKLCPTCGHSNRFTAKNCSQCGAPFYLVRVDGEMRKRCTTCGTYNRMAAKVCTQCGTPYRTIRVAARGQVQKWCPQCGAPRSLTAKVCTRCGFRFVKRSPTPEAPVTLSERFAQPVDLEGQTAPSKGTPKPDFDLSGEPAPFISSEDLKRLSQPARPNSRLADLIDLIRSLLGDGR